MAKRRATGWLGSSLPRDMIDSISISASSADMSCRTSGAKFAWCRWALWEAAEQTQARGGSHGAGAGASPCRYIADACRCR